VQHGAVGPRLLVSFAALTTACGTGRIAESADDQPDAAPIAVTRCDLMPATNHPPLEAIKKLATTHDEVRILVYGQSISAQEWWLAVEDWLHQTYPEGNLVMENHARGACSSECLVGRESWADSKTENRLPGDVFAWHPDLVLFHVYGGDEDYAYVVKGFAEGCSAFDDHPAATAHCRPDQQVPDYQKREVLLQTDHRQTWSYPLTPDGENGRIHDEEVIPGLARQYGFAYADIWHEWADYLDTHGRDPEAFLADGLHLNDQGNALMAALIERDLCYRPAP
jgi:hypothetical protein